VDRPLRPRGLRDALTVTVAKAALSAAVLATGFRAISDDDYARVVIAQGWAHAPGLDPSGTSWLPVPFWTTGTAMLAFGRSLGVARATAFALGVGAVLLCWLAARWLWAERDGDDRAALFAGLAAAALLGVATVPELPTAALLVLALASLVAPATAARGAVEAERLAVRRRLLGAACLLLACLSRYEAWPVALCFAVLCAVDAWPRSPAPRPRRPAGALAGAAGLALAGPLAWVLWNGHAHGDFLHFAARVAAYRDALVGEPGPGTLRSLADYLGATARAEPHLVAFTAAWVALVALPHTRAAGAVEALGRARRPLLISGVLLLSLAWAGGRSGAPTHHAERALLAAMLVVAMVGAVVVLRTFREARRKGTAWVPALACAAALVTGVVVMRLFPGESLLPRQQEVAIGRAAASAVSAGEKVLLQVDDYGYLAVMAATGRPEDVVPDRSPDPRLQREASAFRDVEALRARAASVGARVVVGKSDAPAAVALGAPVASAGGWAVWRVTEPALARCSEAAVLLPGPGGGHDALQVGVPGPPAELGARPLGGGHQLRRVACAPRGDLRLDALAGDLLARGHDLAHRVTALAPQVEGAARRAAAQALQGQAVRRGQVADVHVVAHAGAVRRVPVIAEDAQRGLAAGGCLEHQRQEVGLRVVRLTGAATLVRAGGVEVAQRGGADAVRHVEGRQHALAEELALAVRAHRLARVRLVDGHAHRVAEDNARRGEDDLVDLVIAHGLEQGQRAADVVAEVKARLGDRLAHVGVGGEVDHRLHAVRGEDAVQTGAVADVAYHQRHVADGLAVAAPEVVEHDHLLARLSRVEHVVAAHIARAAGDQDHGCPPSTTSPAARPGARGAAPSLDSARRIA